MLFRFYRPTRPDIINYLWIIIIYISLIIFFIFVYVLPEMYKIVPPGDLFIFIYSVLLDY